MVKGVGAAKEYVPIGKESIMKNIYRTGIVG